MFSNKWSGFYEEGSEQVQLFVDRLQFNVRDNVLEGNGSDSFGRVFQFQGILNQANHFNFKCTYEDSSETCYFSG
jgi:hypothetical protein